MSLKRGKMLSSWYCIFVCSIFGAHGQSDWKIMATEEVVTDTLFVLKSKPTRSLKAYSFHLKDREEKGCPALVEVEIKDSVGKWELRFDPPIRTEYDRLAYDFSDFADNIAYYELGFCFGSDTVWSKTNTYYSGYQHPYNWMPIDDSPSIKDYDGKERRSGWVSLEKVICRVRSKSGTGKFAVGDFKLLRQERKKSEIGHPFLNERKINSAFTAPLEVPVNTTPPFLYPLMSTTTPAESIWYIEAADAGTEIDESAALHEIVELCIDKYPFYRERAIDRRLIREKFDSISALRTGNIYDYAHSVRRLIEQFGDGHFKMSVPRSGAETTAAAKISPIRIAKIHSNYYLSAVFQKDDHAAWIGTEVVGIDGVDLDTLLHRIASGNRILNEESALMHYLTKNRTDSTLLTLRKEGRDTCIAISYAAPMLVPDNFKIKHQRYRYFPGGIMYIQLTSFLPEDFGILMAQFERIKKAKGLIFDIRNNGGGSLGTAASIISLFISKPEVLSGTEDVYGNKSSLVIKPYASTALRKNIVVLVNEGTACASEVFADAMRRNAGAVILGSKSTAGALSSITQIHFPSGIKLTTNAFSDREFIADGSSIEKKGIAPDIYIDIRQVRDFYPYDDRCLSAACEYLNQIK